MVGTPSPTPGSDGARMKGCMCPRDANVGGRGYLPTLDKEVVSQPLFLIDLDCALHGIEQHRAALEGLVG